MGLNKGRRLLVSAVLAAVLLCGLVLGGISIVNTTLKNPYKQHNNVPHAFIMLNQLTQPDCVDSTYETVKRSFFEMLGNEYKAQMTLSSPGGEVTGTLSGGRKSVSLTELKGQSPEMVKQELFLSGKACDLPEKVDKDAYYRVWVRFAERLTGEQVQERYNLYLDHAQASDRQSGAVWIAVQTDESEEAVCLGMQGRLARYHEHLEEVLPVAAGADWMTPSVRESLFIWSLHYLHEHPQETDLIMNSGLYGDENLNIEQKIHYINTHGVQAMGMSLYLKGDLLSAFSKDSDAVIVRCEKSGA